MEHQLHYYYFFFFAEPKNQNETCSVNWCTKEETSKKKREKTLDLDAKTAKLTSFLTQVLKHDIPIPGQSQSLLSEVDTNAINSTLFTSESRCDKVPQAGSSSACAEIEINSTSIEITTKDGSVADHGDC